MFNIDQPQLENNLIRFDHYDVIDIKGTEALEFLHSQFTNDLKNLPENSSSLGAWCSPKGRVLYTFRIWHEGETFHLVLPSSQTESFLKRLKMYILRADVEAEVSAAKIVYGLSGENSNQLIKNAPENDNAIQQNDETTFIKIPSSLPRYLIVSENSNLQLGSLQVAADQKSATNQWRLLDIISGVPEILPETADMFLPQMLNLENLGGLSFQKGCYPGQEIVARVKYRGELKKQLYKASLSTSNEIQPGASLVVSNDETEILAGNLVNIAHVDDNKWAVLAVINIKSATNDSIKLQDDKESQLKLQLD